MSLPLPSPASRSPASPPASPAVPGDRELVARLRRGDAGALDLLLQRHWPPVVAYLVRIVGSQDAAEDIAQRTFCRLWERRARWRDSGSLRGLVYRVARNLALSERRRWGAEARSAAAATGLRPPPAPPSPLELLEDRQLRHALDGAVQALPARRREVFVLRCIHGLSYREIAAITGTAPQTVANQLSRALATLRATLAPQLDR